jgi:hypothetical protein
MICITLLETNYIHLVDIYCCYCPLKNKTSITKQLKFYELSHIGEFHVNHNEDFLVSEEAGKSRRMIAVMDGLSYTEIG